MICLQSKNVELMDRYIRDELPEGELEKFETHVLECDACAEELEKLATLSAELGSRREEIEAQGDSDASSPRRLWMAVAAVLAAALGLVLVLQPWRRMDLVDLASIEPPEYKESRIRGAADDGDALFTAGMALYEAEDYEDAIPDLEGAAALDPERTDVRFFLGASRLLIGKTTKGVEDLDRVIQQGDTPYLEEALYLRAQASLLRGDARAAATDLRSILELDGDWEERAKNQLEQVKALSKADS